MTPIEPGCLDGSANLAIVQERQRIAADLHDTVLQRLYAAGMGLTRAVLAEGVAHGSPVLVALEEIDEAIVQLRASILAMRGEFEESELVASVERVINHAGRELPTTPGLTITGPLTTLPADEGRQLLAVLNEAVSNVLRHAHATRLEVGIDVDGDQVTLHVRDDGVGLGEPDHHVGGLENMRRRAATHGGTFDVGPRPGGGTELAWTIPRP